jgi:hypothetical protein
METDLRSTNGFLASLPDDEFELIRPHLLVADLNRSSVLIEVGHPFKNVFMPHSGVISLVVKLLGGERIEIARSVAIACWGRFPRLATRFRFAKRSSSFQALPRYWTSAGSGRQVAKARICAKPWCVTGRPCWHRLSKQQLAMLCTRLKAASHVVCCGSAICPAVTASF